LAKSAFSAGAIGNRRDRPFFVSRNINSPSVMSSQRSASSSPIRAPVMSASRISAGRRERGEEVTFVVSLIPEPQNQYDSHAVRVDITGGSQVGYLPREETQAYRTVMLSLTESQRLGICRARLIGGTEGKPSFGVMIDLADPDSLLSRLTTQPF
jgi:hypothetical protein